jgi:uncharacterized membrane protein
MEFLNKFRILNINALKFLAAFFMVIDHIGLMFFPYILEFRILGRLSMPLFAFALAEGCNYTRDKLKHFLLLFVLAVICQTVYYFFDNGNLYMCILVTFSLAVLTIYALQYCKRCLFSEGVKLWEKIFSTALTTDPLSKRNSDRLLQKPKQSHSILFTDLGRQMRSIDVL